MIVTIERLSLLNDDIIWHKSCIFYDNHYHPSMVYVHLYFKNLFLLSSYVSELTMIWLPLKFVKSPLMGSRQPKSTRQHNTENGNWERADSIICQFSPNYAISRRNYVTTSDQNHSKSFKYSTDLLYNLYGESLPLMRRGSMFSGLVIAAFIPNWKSVIGLRNRLRLIISVLLWLATNMYGVVGFWVFPMPEKKLAK